MHEAHASHCASDFFQRHLIPTPASAGDSRRTDASSIESHKDARIDAFIFLQRDNKKVILDGLLAVDAVCS